MSRSTTFIIMVAGISLLFYFAGFVSWNPFLGILLNPESIEANDTITILIGFTIVGASIIIGFFTKNTELIAMGYMLTIMIPTLFNIVSVFKVLAEVNRVLAVLIFGPLLFMLVIALIDWWRGRD